MAVLRKLVSGIKALFHLQRTEQEMDEELTGYFDELVAAKLREGATPEEARRAARLQMGNMDGIKHQVRSVGWEFSVDTFFRDLRYGLRLIRKSPGFSALAILAIAIGIGANTAIFSVVDAILLRPLPYPEPGQLIAAGMHQRGSSGIHPMGVADFLAWRDQQHSFEHVAVFDGGAGSLSLSGLGTPERVPGITVSADFFTTLGVKPINGRGFQTGEDRPGSAPVAVISEQFWRDHLGSDSRVTSRSITLDGRSHAIVGVMPASFRFPFSQQLDVWAIRTFGVPSARPPYGLRAVGRLKRSSTVQMAETELNGIAAQVTKQFPSSPELDSSMVPLKDWMVKSVSTALLLLLGAISLVLLIAIVNVANLLLARASVRQREITVRVALGATRARVLRQLLTESMMLSLLGGAVGLLLAFVAVKAFLTFGPGHMPRLEEVGINAPVLLFTFVLCVGSGIMFGLAPAFATSRHAVNGPLKDSERGASSASAQRTHRVLVISEIALALLLMIGSGLLIRSFLRLRDVNPGFQADHVITAAISLPPSYASSAQIGSFWKQFLAKVESTPGVSSVGSSMSIPPNLLEITNPFTVEGQGYDRGRILQLAEEMTVSPGYFRALGIPLLKGRFFSESDQVEQDKDPMIVIINETMAKKYFPDQDPVGRRIQTGDPDPRSPWETIVGVVGDVKYSGLDAQPAPTLYVPYNENGWIMWSRDMYLVVRTPLEPAAIVPALRAQLESINRDIPLASVQTMDHLIEDSVVQEKFRTWLVGIFAGLALLLAAIGIYAVISYSVVQRTREIGVRIALGADRIAVLSMVLGQGMKLATAGLSIGVVAAFAVTRVLRSLLYSTSTTDPLSYLATSAVLMAVVVLACYVPARRATKVDPITALRYE
ncbi:MAG TPA: ABC transporter permease [Candidatus Angelobacter sp.]|jgi:putative ABC transport system permease protein|nr:ABC transporter permease [Candidatus Angelobacter sp.]